MKRIDKLMDSGVLELLKQPPAASHEEMVIDRRAELRPSEIVQAKLIALMPRTAIPVSCLHTSRETYRGNHS